MQYFTTIAAASALFSFVSAHGGVVEYSFNGDIYAGTDPGRASIKKRSNKTFINRKRESSIQREWDSWDPVDAAIGSTLTICNDPGSPATAYATIAAGGTVSACYNDPWAHNSGPLSVYMAACPDDDCTTVTSADLDALQWFAIYKEGLIDGSWATELYMMANSNCITHIIPETLVAGSYLIRHETINLAKVEFYANCANVKVTGSGTATPSAEFLKTIAEIYVDGDAALVAIDSTPDSYTMAGPNVWPADTAEGGQIFEVTGIKNACSGQAQSSGGDCQDGGDDTTNPTPPNPQATGSTTSDSTSSDSSDETATSTTESGSKATTTAKAAKSTTTKASKATTTKSSTKATSTASSKATTTDETATEDESAEDTTATEDETVSASSTASAAVATASTDSSSSDTTTSSSSGTVAAYGQCGGGSVAAASCVDGYTCTYVNEWYSQCVAA